MSLDPRTPVLVGAAQISQRPDDLDDAVEAVELMRRTVVEAAIDADMPELLRRLDLVAVVYGAWKYPDPGRLIADAVGSPQARSLMSFHGGNTPQSMVNAVARRIAAGELAVAAITGAEAIWSGRRRRQAGLGDNRTEQDAPTAERFGADVPMSTDVERARGLEQPINHYPIFESAIRADRGWTNDEHRDVISRLWAGFNTVAAANPHAWSPTPMTAAEIREASPANRMVGWPYTKAMNSNWDLDQGASLLLCSVAAAEAAGVPRDRWVFPLAGTDAHDTYTVTGRRDLHSSPAIAAAGRRLGELAGRAPAEADHVDIYSCFPSAVQVGVAELGLDLERQLTVTGGLPFAGGPLNNYVTHSIATMVGVLRNDPGSLGLITANGGYLTKHALGFYSTEPPADGFRWDDVQDEVDAAGSTVDDTGHVGAVTVEAATVMHDRSGPSRGLAALRTGRGRTWGWSTEATTMSELMADDIVGRTGTVDADGVLALD